MWPNCFSPLNYIDNLFISVSVVFIKSEAMTCKNSCHGQNVTRIVIRPLEIIIVIFFLFGPKNVFSQPLAF